MKNYQIKNSNYIKNEKEREIKNIHNKNPDYLNNNVNKHKFPPKFNYPNIYQNQNSQYAFNYNNNSNDLATNITTSLVNNAIKKNDKQSLVKNNNQNYNQYYNANIPINRNDKNINYEKNTYLKKNINVNVQHPIFLHNVGNTTYLSTVIRCLACIIGFYDYYLKRQQDIILHRERIPITYFLSRIIVHLFQSNGKNFYSLEKFHKILIYYNPIFRGKSTKNAIDFLIYLIGQLHEDYKMMHNKNYNENSIQEADCHNYEKFKQYLKEKENSNVFNEFSWINRNKEICWECNKEIKTYKMFYTYDLDFENALNKAILNNKKEVSILDCINLASEQKNIYNVFCNNCNRKNNFKKISTIYSSSKTLILLIREIEKKEVINEITKHQIKIKINESLNIYKQTNKSKPLYSLYGLISYDTGKLEYIAYSINPINKKWYKYAKEKIVPIELKDFINEYDFHIFPVILFYRL